MCKRSLAAAMASLAAVLLAATSAQAAEFSDYTIKQLLEPCMEGENDWGWAYLTTVAGGAEGVACLPPPGNRDTEIRWAFMKWAHNNFDQRGRPAAEGMMATLREAFGCK
jgi:hypothetical protein